MEFGFVQNSVFPRTLLTFYPLYLGVQRIPALSPGCPPCPGEGWQALLSPAAAFPSSSSGPGSCFHSYLAVFSTPLSPNCFYYESCQTFNISNKSFSPSPLLFPLSSPQPLSLPFPPPFLLSFPLLSFLLPGLITNSKKAADIMKKKKKERSTDTCYNVDGS